MYAKEESIVSFWALCRHPVFFIQSLLAMLLFISFLMGAIKQWPSFLEEYRWAFFLNIGTVVSLFFMEVASIMSWLVFENSNWVYYVLTYLTHGVILLICGAFFFTYSVMKYSPGQDLWPCVGDNNNKDICIVSTQQKITEGFLIVTASAYLCLCFYIMIVKDKFAK